MSTQFCRTGRQKVKNVTDWEDHHAQYVDMWNTQRHRRLEMDRTPDNEHAYNVYLEWLRREYRLVLKGAFSCEDVVDLLPGDGDIAFNNTIRETIGSNLDYAPLHDRVVCVHIS